MTNAASEIIPNEQWRPIVGWEGFYEVSNLGRVRSIKITILKPLHTPNGYQQVGPCRAPVRARLFVHRLVAEAFIGKLSGKLEVNHKNGLRDDNRVENLEIVSSSQNHLHSYRVLGQRHEGLKGEACPLAKLTAADVTAIRTRRADGERSVDLAREFGVRPDYIWRILTRKTWKHIP